MQRIDSTARLLISLEEHHDNRTAESQIAKGGIVERDADYYEDPDEDDDNEEEEDYDCGIIVNWRGTMEGCTMIGSEQCDFECPYRDSLFKSLAIQAGLRKRKDRVRKTQLLFE
jgi:hypothetical protein